MKPKKVEAYACGAEDCGFISQSEDKVDKHTREQHIPTYFEIVGYKCSKCGKLFDSDEEVAEKCCRK